MPLKSRDALKNYNTCRNIFITWVQQRILGVWVEGDKKWDLVHYMSRPLASQPHFRLLTSVTKGDRWGTLEYKWERRCDKWGTLEDRNLQGVLFFRCRSKLPIFAKITISNLSSMLIWKRKKMFWRLRFKYFFLTFSEIQKYCKNHVAFCQNMAQRKRCVLFCPR